MTDHQKVVFIDGVGAGRSSIKSCRDGVQWIRVGDRVYWPLSDADARRLQSACCGNGTFDGPTSSAGDGTPLPRINVKCETVDNGITGSAFLKVIRVEQEDDGSLTVVIDHWPRREAPEKDRETHENTTDALLMMEEREQRDEALLRQALEVLSRAHQTAMEQTLRARVPECAEFAGIAQDLDFVVAALRERLGEKV